MIAVSLGHMAYLIIRRPYAAQVEQGVAMLLAVLQIVLAILVVIALDAGTHPWSLRLLGGAQLAFDAATFISLVVVAAVVVLQGLRKRLSRRLKREDQCVTSPTDVPMLQIPQAA
jgi:predicted Co/Zn/Cd cation transporter (cation efflux family)